MQTDQNQELGLHISSETGHQEMNWHLSARPFEKQREKYTDEQIRYIQGELGSAVSWDEIKYPLGFQEKDVESWKKNRSKILEVGPGRGVAFEWLVNHGIDAYALEPSLLLDDEENSYILEAKRRMGQSHLKDRVQAAKAADARYVFPQTEFDVAFAMGPNFQNYSHTVYEFIAQVAGILDTLNKTPESFLSFEIGKNGRVQLNIFEEEDTTFDLIQFLEDNKIRFLVKPAVGDTVKQAVNIFSQSNEGNDTLALLVAALKKDLTHYVHAGHPRIHE